jgi:hypothetical protein
VTCLWLAKLQIRFATYRRQADGCFTERSLKEYLVLASVFETCEFNNVNILKFLLSKETTLEGLLKLARRRAKTSREVSMNNDCDQNHAAFGSSDAENPDVVRHNSSPVPSQCYLEPPVFAL